MSGDEKPAARLPRGIRENAGLFQFIMMRFVVTSITVAFLLLGGFYWPIPEMAGMVAAQLWMLTARSHNRDGDPLRPLSNPWKREEPTAEQGRRIVAALASEEWRAIKRRWYAISAAACIAIWIAAPIVKHAVNEIEPYAALRFNAMNGIVIIFGVRRMDLADARLVRNAHGALLEARYSWRRRCRAAGPSGAELTAEGSAGLTAPFGPELTGQIDVPTAQSAVS